MKNYESFIKENSEVKPDDSNHYVYTIDEVKKLIRKNSDFLNSTFVGGDNMNPHWKDYFIERKFDFEWGNKKKMSINFHKKTNPSLRNGKSFSICFNDHRRFSWINIKNSISQSPYQSGQKNLLFDNMEDAIKFLEDCNIEIEHIRNIDKTSKYKI